VSDTQYLIKGGTFRAYVKQLADTNRLETVLGRVSPETAALARNLPMPSSWIDAHRLNEIVLVIYTVEGPEAALRLGRDVVDKQMLPFFLPMLRGIMKVIGVSPASLFSRYQGIVQTIVKGIGFTYTVTSPRSGIMDLRYAITTTVHRGVFSQNIAGFESIFKVCGVKGTIGEVEILGPQHARFPLSW
jgi:hypothetical protein